MAETTDTTDIRRAIMELRYEGLTDNEIARRLDTPLAVVRAELAAAIRQAADDLGVRFSTKREVAERLDRYRFLEGVMARRLERLIETPASSTADLMRCIQTIRDLQSERWQLLVATDLLKPLEVIERLQTAAELRARLKAALAGRSLKELISEGERDWLGTERPNNTPEAPSA